MKLPPHKTKIVGTVGPASSSPEMLDRLIRAGMTIARLNFSHGTFDQHQEMIHLIRAASAKTGRRVAIMADLPGPKMRLGKIEPGPITLAAGDTLILTNQVVLGDQHRISMSFEPLPRVVKPGDQLFLNDGLVHLVVERVDASEVHCKVAVGGKLSSRKGLNLPRIDLGISAFTDDDRKCLEFALAQGVDAVSQSFVENGADVVTVRRAAADLGQRLFLIAKIERYGALAHLDEIVREADGIMIARGDLGVEAPIEEIALLQKKLIGIANQAGKPVITATQMLESMTSNRLPTRAEATDVANAILDGTDAVMLSGESAVGMFPEEAVAMLGKIAALTEPHRTRVRPPQPIQTSTNSNLTAFERLAKFAEHALDAAPCDAVIVPTRTGTTARAIARSRPPVWIIAVGPDSVTQQGLAFSYGVHPLVLNEDPEDWAIFAKHSMPQLGIAGRHAMLVAGPSPRHPLAHHRLEIFELSSE